MSSESLKESLSALMDNEADELEVRRVLKACGDESSLRSDWARYQAARAVMHKEPWQNKIDLTAGIAAAIANDPVPTPATAPAKASRVWQSVGRLAVAASVTVAVLVGFNMFQKDGGAASPAMVADQAPPVALPSAPAAQAGAVLAGYSQSTTEELDAPQAPSAWQEEKISTYLREHAGQGDAEVTPQLLPNARAASLEGQ
ncbi:sigma-E factor negative regulatory protein [uncultured Halopseudomonas sp.]|uniref:sigma-E factor negative regulatory protein n=1 Tax=uncultured Halopseudomonas sp. TaxID=2901193 RepID=UPI0030EC8E2C|tara:strand:- start:38045 stop:38647 length:603 start_codon:yes stop_codon:yes gene_type:complete